MSGLLSKLKPQPVCGPIINLQSVEPTVLQRAPIPL